MGGYRDRQENQTESHFPTQDESWERPESSRDREEGNRKVNTSFSTRLKRTMKEK